MSAVHALKAPAATRQLLSGNEAIARAAWEAGIRVATSYPGTPATEILEALSIYPDLHAEFSVNEKVAMEVAIGASMSGARAICSMKHVGMNVAADAFMTFSYTGAKGGLVIVVADDVGLSSSQNEQDSRYWGRFGHMPVLEPADSAEAHRMTLDAFDLSERFATPVILRATTRVCHVKAMVTLGERRERPASGFVREPQRWVMVPGNAGRRLPLLHERDRALLAEAEASALNLVEDGSDKRVGFVTSGPAYLHLREAFPDAPILKLGFSHPLPIELARRFAQGVERVVVAEETEPLVETELKAAGLAVAGKDVLPRWGELLPQVITPPIKALLGEPLAAGAAPPTAPQVFPRPPTLCVACPHMGAYFALSHMREKVLISGDIGCYTLGAGHPWTALDATICMGASMGIALGMDKGRAEGDQKKAVVAVIGDSTFLHMGMQGLLDITYNRGNVTVLLLDNRTTGMTGGQNNPGCGRDVRGDEAPQIDFPLLVEALGVRKERIRIVDPYELPTLTRALREETAIPEPSVIITNRPCTLIDEYQALRPYHVEDDRCTGCGACTDVGCPSITVTRREQETRPSGAVVDLSFVTIDVSTCTGCGMCVKTCGAKAILGGRSIDGVSL
jgi:indolepyruvate ferredoxin oxidoreductase, alpha subunit